MSCTILAGNGAENWSSQILKLIYGQRKKEQGQTDHRSEEMYIKEKQQIDYQTKNKQTQSLTNIKETKEIVQDNTKIIL